jgi:hypothetical protein
MEQPMYILLAVHYSVASASYIKPTLATTDKDWK